VKKQFVGKQLGRNTSKEAIGKRQAQKSRCEEAVGNKQ